MPRARKGAARRQSKVRWFKKAAGNRMGRRSQWRRVKSAVVRAGVYQYAHRKQNKRNYRALWIVRLSAATAENGINYSTFINGLKLAGIALNRKMLSEIAIHEPAAFTEIVKIAVAARTKFQAALPAASAARKAA